MILWLKTSIYYLCWICVLGKVGWWFSFETSWVILVRQQLGLWTTVDSTGLFTHMAGQWCLKMIPGNSGWSHWQEYLYLTYSCGLGSWEFGSWIQRRNIPGGLLGVGTSHEGDSYHRSRLRNHTSLPPHSVGQSNSQA